MSALPTGTVTFLFTDIEGSTKLWEQHSDAMPAALARHHEILHEAIASHHGHVFRIAGDAFCAAFHTANAALQATLTAQRALHKTSEVSETSEVWPLRVRMGIHTGAAEARDGDYDGYLTLTRTQRVMSIAHGGQVLLSQTTYDLVRDTLSPGVTLRDMGQHRLKGLLNPEHLWQVVAADLPQDFPPLQTLNAIPNNLPIQPTSFIGREQAIAHVKQLLATTHLLTLTGVGGTGKTRLALQVGASLADAHAGEGKPRPYADGVWFIELAPLTDPALVSITIASVLGVREEQGRPLIATLLDVLRAKQLLFLLDNCEHLIEACAQFADSVLRACPHVKLLTSSREALGIAGETTYRVPSLSLPLPPDFRSLQDFGSLTQYEAVRLFVERAVAVKSDFQVTHANALAVAQLCQRVDGIPLALELAAARVKSLSVEQIAARLDNQFRLLTGGSRTALPRQQTLRAMIDWSHNLLNETERVLFRRLAVFAGGWTLEAAEQVCSDERLAVEDIVDLLDQLVNKSLVVVEEQEGDSGAVRYRYLETIRQYAREKLLDVREGEGVRNRQLTYFMELAEQAEQKFRGTEQLAWFYRLETELDNLRAAIEWALESQQIEAGLRLAASAYLFWFELNHVGEGLHHLEDLLAKQVNKAPSSLYAKALLIAARFYGDYSRLSEMNSYAEEGLAIGQQLANMPIIVEAHDVLVHLARRQGNYARAFELLADNLVIYETLRDEYGIAETLSGQAKTAHMNNDYVQAQALYEKCLPLFRQWGVSDLVALTLRHLGYALLQQNSDSKVIKPFKESLALNLKLKDQLSTISSFTAFAAVAVRAGQSLRAVKIYGAAEALMKLVDRPIGALDHRYYRPLA